MDAAVTGFLTGFLKNSAGHIKKRKDEGEEFFSKQMELARTKGMENRNKRQTEMNASLTVAKQLVQKGVPKDVVMAIANQNPEDLGSFQEIVNKLELEGTTVSPEFFRSIAEVGGNFKAPDEDLGTFFDRIFRPLADNVKNSPEDFEKDPKGSVWATMMGYNAIGQAQKKLDNTTIIDDQSASDVLAYNTSTERAKPYGDSTVNFNYGNIGEASRAAEEANKGTKELSPNEVKLINEQFDTVAESEYNEAKKSILKWNQENPDKPAKEVPSGSWDKSPFADVIRKKTAARISTEMGYSMEDLAQLPRVSSPEAFDAPAAPTPETPTPTTPTSGMTKELPNGDVFVKELGNGVSVWRRKNGDLYKTSNDKILEYLNKKKAPVAN